MKTMIAIPCMDTVPTRFMTSLLAMRRVGDCSLVAHMNSLIYDARNQTAREAVKEEFDRVLWLDSDMEFEPDLMERLSARLDEGRDFVSGLYFKRKPPHEPVIYRELGIRDRDDGKQEAYAAPYTDYPESGVFEVEACGFGAVMTTVKMLRDLTERYGLPFTPETGFSEDISFCLRAQETGYRIWCDSGIRAGHIGTKVYGEEDWHV